jgi:hypothetical protein
MDVFHIDIVLYICYLLLSTPKVIAEEIHDWESKVFFVAFSFFVFTIILFLSKTFPLVMLFFLGIGLMDAIIKKFKGGI